MTNYNPFSLEGRIILVTGASSGLGVSIAVETSKMGAEVIITGRNEGRLNDTFLQLEGQNNKKIEADLLNAGDIDNLVENLPVLNGIVFNAGIARVTPVKYIGNKDIEQVFETNIISSIRIVQKLLKQRKIAKGGSIVFISSISSSRATPGNSLYAATKGGINSFAKVLALELVSKQITVNCIEPGFIKTAMIDDGIMTEDELEAHYKSFPLRKGLPTDISHACVYLLSNAGTWITGSVFVIDGGFCLT
jgi:NAD(P)-dependent dehydrogenase (short-subunit alcohol dehydrogenase family)